MDDAEKEKQITKLNKIHEILEYRINIVNDEIEHQTRIIEENKNHLQYVTQEIVDNEFQLNKIRRDADQIGVELKGLESQIDDYKSEIENNKGEISRLQEKIRDQLPKDDFWHNINPINVIEDFIKLINNDISECQQRINDLDMEINNKIDNLNELERKRIDCDVMIYKINSLIPTLTNQRMDLEYQLKELGIEKTKNEDFKLELEYLKTQSKLIIDDIEQGKDLLEIGINVINEIEEKVKILFSSNGLTISF
ncbi:hypothetical protein ACTA71_010145 [Dictyostelium dimigraforme]